MSEQCITCDFGVSLFAGLLILFCVGCICGVIVAEIEHRRALKPGSVKPRFSDK